MVRLIGKIVVLIVNVIMIPIVVVLAIPTGILKAKRAQKSRLLFTGDEQSLFAKAQRAINMENNGLFSPDEDLLEVARCIEDARCDYQSIKSREKFDVSFTDFVIPRILQSDVMDWENVSTFFKLPRFTIPGVLHELPSVQDLVRALQNFIAGYKEENGVTPKTVMLDYNVHLMFANAGVYKNGKDYFGNTEIIPVANIEGGLTWKAVEPDPKNRKLEYFDDDIPF